MRLQGFLRSDLVLLGLRGDGMEDVVHRIVEHLIAREIVGPEQDVERGLLKRERSHTTVLGAGIAVPHALVPGLDEPLLMVAVGAEPIAFGPTDVEPVSVFFVLLSPPGYEGQHIKLLARICRLAHDSDLVDRLMASEDEDAAIAVLEGIDERHV